MLLTIDIGNTNIIAGVFDGDRLLAHWRVATDYARTADEYGITFLDVLTTRGVEPRTIQSVALSSVVPPLTPVFGKMSQNYFHSLPLIVSSDLDTGLTFRFDQPQEIGSDRIVNSAAAFSRYGGPIVIVDFGTAITFCVVTQSGEYLGGAIAPGIQISADSLAQRAAKLSSVELILPKEVIGKKHRRECAVRHHLWICWDGRWAGSANHAESWKRMSRSGNRRAGSTDRAGVRNDHRGPRFAHAGGSAVALFEESEPLGFEESLFSHSVQARILVFFHSGCWLHLA